MLHLARNDLALFFASIALIIFFAKLIASLCRRISFPSVAGELIAGIILGPTILGAISPQLSTMIFPKTGAISFAFDAVFYISMIMLLLAAGLEIDLDQIIKNKKTTIYTSFIGILIPFVTGFFIIYFYPNPFLSNTANTNVGAIASFVGIALSLSALPVLARILSEINLLNNYIGITIMSVAFVTDIIAWLVFSIIMGVNAHHSYLASIYGFVALIAFTLFMLGKSSSLIEKLIFAKIQKPCMQLAATLVITLICAAFTEYLGFHAAIGAFIAGIALHKAIKKSCIESTINHFTNGFFAPIFFVSVGLKLNFYSSFNLPLILLIIFLAFITKVVGAGLGAYLSGINFKNSLAIGFGLNVRGSIEIIICTIALNVGMISKNLFVAFVSMALVTSLVSGPIMLRLLKNN
jgi:Kef-type K+ transport system membrane component KefB